MWEDDDTDSIDVEIIEMLGDEDAVFENGEYCIGSYFVDNEEALLLINNRIERNWFLSRTAEQVVDILTICDYAGSHCPQYCEPHIMQLCLTNALDGLPLCAVVLKTHWIRIIQRVWKRVYHKWARGRFSLSNMINRERTGGFPPRPLLLRGMLAPISRSCGVVVGCRGGLM